MSMTIDLPPYVETYLREEAAKQETPVEEYTAHLVEDLVPKPLPPSPMPELKTGADVVAYWQKEGVIGMWADRKDMEDSTEYVNRLKRRIEEDILAKQRVPGSNK